MHTHIDNSADEAREDRSLISAGSFGQRVRVLAQALSAIDSPLLILGESGSGKELIARLIHNFSARSGYQFVRVDCAKLPPNLSFTELVSHTTNAYSEVDSSSSGQPCTYCHGTILLDHLTAMPSEYQSELLTVLERAKSVAPGKHDAAHSMRILAAADMRIYRALAEGVLNEGIYYHLGACTVQIPPLRHRREEIALLLDLLMQRMAAQYALKPRTFSAAMVELCQAYAWPGNFLELEEFVNYYYQAGADDCDSTPSEYRNDYETWQGFLKQESVPSSASDLDVLSSKSLLQNIRGEAERCAIARVLEQTKWNRKAAARILRVSYRTLLYKIEQYHIVEHRHPPRFHHTA